MIDLGKYSFDILLAYGLSGLLITGLVAQSIVASRATKQQLEEAEE